MKRKIIKIDEGLCNGCGNCVTGCSEGALQLVDGIAKLVKEDFCDGFGDCIGTCPTGALTIEEREAPPFNEEATKKHLLKIGGKEAVQKMEEAQRKHHIKHLDCPGMQTMTLNAREKDTYLEQWPIQLHLVNPNHPVLNNKEMVILSTCSSVVSPQIHTKYIKGRSVIIACPKLDRTDPYVEKLKDIFDNATIPKIIVLRMEVPCCGGLTEIVKKAAEISTKSDLLIEEHILGINGNFQII